MIGLPWFLVSLVLFFSIFPEKGASHLKVLAPNDLKESIGDGGEVSYIFGDFGHLPYGDTLNGILALPEKEYPSKDYNVILGCEGVKPIDPSRYPGYATFLVFSRGECSFAQKGLNAQKAGASAVLILDYMDEDVKDIHMVDDQKCKSHEKSNEKITNGFWEAATGDSVSIPVLMLDHKKGEAIRTYMLNHTDDLVLMYVDFLVPTVDGIVDWKTWTSVIDAETFGFLKEFSVIHDYLYKYSRLSPYFYTFVCGPCHEENFSSRKENCYSGGRYCYKDPDDKGPLNGLSVLNETIRQVCLFQIYGENIWYNYSKAYYMGCLANGLPSNLEKCSSKIYSKINADEKKVQECFENSFQGDPYVDDNLVLKSQLEAYSSSSIHRIPMILINNFTYRGEMMVPDVAEALCSGFSNPPEGCRNLSKLIEMSFQDKTEEVAFDLLLALGAIFSILLLIGCFCAFRKLQDEDINRDLNFHISTAITQYQLLQEREKKLGGDTESIGKMEISSEV